MGVQICRDIPPTTPPGHIQVSQVPGRHEPDDNGEINFPFLFHTLTSSSYTGWLGCEYTPRGEATPTLILLILTSTLLYLLLSLIIILQMTI